MIHVSFIKVLKLSVSNKLNVSKTGNFEINHNLPF